MILTLFSKRTTTCLEDEIVLIFWVGELESLLVIYFKPTYGGDDGVRKKHSKSLRVLARRYFMWLLPVGKLQRAAQVVSKIRLCYPIP